MARIVNTIALAIIVVLAVYTFARPQLFLNDVGAAIANATLLLLLIRLLFVIRRGWVRAAALMLTPLAWINLTIQLWLFGGVRDAAFAAYLLIILTASLLLGWRAPASRGPNHGFAQRKRDIVEGDSPSGQE